MITYLIVYTVVAMATLVVAGVAYMQAFGDQAEDFWMGICTVLIGLPFVSGVIWMVVSEVFK